MTPSEKALELIKKYYYFVSGWTTNNHPRQPPSAQFEGEEMKLGRAKQCALICVDEIINGNFGDGYDHQFWECVKEEIEKLCHH